MSRRPLYVAAFVAPLAALFVLGNPDLSGGTRSVDSFPSLLSFLAVPVAVGLILHDSARRGRTAAALVSEGRAVSLWAAVVFALCVGSFGIGFYWHEGTGFDFRLSAFGAAVTFGMTYLLGWVATQGWSRVLGTAGAGAG